MKTLQEIKKEIEANQEVKRANDADDYAEEIATAIIRERDGLGVDAFDNLIKLYFNKYM